MLRKFQILACHRQSRRHKRVCYAATFLCQRNDGRQDICLPATVIKNAFSTHTVVQKWGHESCLSLPAFHALTGCDTTSCFHRIGKRSAFKCLLKHLKDVPHLKHLGCQPVSDNCYRDVENFVASLYSQKFESDKSLSRVR